MASTRNKNTIGDYTREQIEFRKRNLYDSYHNYGVNNETRLPGNGLLAGQVYSGNFAKNDRDIESYLFGIGTTNLEFPQPDLVPELKQMQSLNIIDRLPVVVPSTLKIEAKQRPMPLN